MCSIPGCPLGDRKDHEVCVKRADPGVVTSKQAMGEEDWMEEI